MYQHRLWPRRRCCWSWQAACVLPRRGLCKTAPASQVRIEHKSHPRPDDGVLRTSLYCKMTFTALSATASQRCLVAPSVSWGQRDTCLSCSACGPARYHARSPQQLCGCINAKALNPLLCMASAAGNPAEGALLVLDVNTATGELPVFDAASCCAACQSNPEASTALNPLKSTT